MFYRQWDGRLVKCFIKAGILNPEGETNAALVTESTDVDPFADLDEEFNIVNDLFKETSSANAAPIRDKVVGNFDPPVCQELPDNWEDTFFRQVSQVQPDVETNDDAINVSGNDDDGVQGPVAQPKLASHGQALASLEDVQCFLESKRNSKTSNELAKLISQVQSDWLERRTKLCTLYYSESVVHFLKLVAYLFLSRPNWTDL